MHFHMSWRKEKNEKERKRRGNYTILKDYYSIKDITAPHINCRKQFVDKRQTDLTDHYQNCVKSL